MTTLYLYQDDMCMNIAETVTLNSLAGDCQNLLMPGIGLGSKRMDPPIYVQGESSCQPSPTEAIGDVLVDETQAITVCCRDREMPH